MSSFVLRLGVFRPFLSCGIKILEKAKIGINIACPKEKRRELKKNEKKMKKNLDIRKALC